MQEAKERAPESILAEFFNSSDDPVTLGHFDADFLKENGLETYDKGRPFRISISKQISKAGNAFYDYVHFGIPLPEGLTTLVRIEGVFIPMNQKGVSKGGNPFRSGKADIVIGGILYEARAYISKGKTPYYVKIHAHKKPTFNADALKKGRHRPRGGQIV